MGKPSNLLEMLKQIAKYFDQRKLRYVIVGGIAVSVYGYPRSTQDIDIIIDHVQLDIHDFCEHLRGNGFIITEDEIGTAFREKSYATVFHKFFLLG